MKYLTLLSLILPINAWALDLNCVVKSMIKIESSGVADAVNTTDIGVSYGIMQIQLSTAKDMGFKGTLKDLFIPKINKIYGTRYIKWLLKRYNNQLYVSLDAYNRGIKMVEEHPYQGDWSDHPYVKKFIKAMNEFCPDPVVQASLN